MKVCIVGATGYVGKELIRILTSHPRAEVVALSAKIEKPTPISQIFPEFKEIIDLPCLPYSDPESASGAAEIVFLALPHTTSAEVAQCFLSLNKKVIDLSADFRLRNPMVYEKWYGVRHPAPSLLKEAVYGLPELYGEEIKGASLIANPGCYPTSAILALAPLMKDGIINLRSIVIDAKSGISGAGRAPTLSTHFPECNEDLSAYAVGSHRHTPEIEQELSRIAGEEVKVTFVPHLTPLDRGILSTIYVELLKKIEIEEMLALYHKFYEKAPFVRILNATQFPHTKYVTMSNYCDITLRVERRTNRLIILSVLDNLVKGASGQAVQNMNIASGFNEECGLR